MASDAIGEYLAKSKAAAFATPEGAAALTAAVHQRWTVKTGADPDAANLVGQTPTQTTIASLCALATPADRPPDGRTPGAEETVWQLDATLTGYKLESDGDYHLVIDDGQGNHMIAEIPNPADLAPGSFFAQQITAARQAFDTQFGAQVRAAKAAKAAQAGEAGLAGAVLPTLVQVAQEVTLTGLGSFDFAHGQDGVAPNAIELHPVTSIVFHAEGQ